MIKTLNDIRSTHKLSAPKTVKTKVELKYSKFPETACTIPAGTELQVHFSETNPGKIYFEYNGSVRVGTVYHAHKFFTGFSKPPGDKALENMVMDSVAKSATGGRCEPDGYSSDSAPSWLLVLGLI